MTFVSDCLIIDTILCDTKQTCLHPLFIVLMIVTFWRHSPADPLTNNVLLLLRLTTVMMKFQSTSFVNATAGWGRWQVIEPDVSARRLPWAPEIDNSVSWRWSWELPLLHPRSRSPFSMHVSCLWRFLSWEASGKVWKKRKEEKLESSQHLWLSSMSGFGSSLHWPLLQPDWT